MVVGGRKICCGGLFTGAGIKRAAKNSVRTEKHGRVTAATTVAGTALVGAETEIAVAVTAAATAATRVITATAEQPTYGFLHLT